MSPNTMRSVGKRRAAFEETADEPCHNVLDQRIHDQVSTRRLRIVKYRGTAHGTNECRS